MPALSKLCKSLLLDVKAISRFVTVHGSANPETATATVTVNAKATDLGVSLLSDAMAVIRAADPALKAKGLSITLDMQLISAIETLAADIEKLLPGSTAIPAKAS